MGPHTTPEAPGICPALSNGHVMLRHWSRIMTIDAVLSLSVTYSRHWLCNYYDLYASAVFAHWASLWGCPQRWHAKRVCTTPKEKASAVRRLSTTEAIMFSLCPDVPLNTSARWTSPLHTCTSRGIIWPCVVLVSLVLPWNRTMNQNTVGNKFNNVELLPPPRPRLSVRFVCHSAC